MTDGIDGRSASPDVGKASKKSITTRPEGSTDMMTSDLGNRASTQILKEKTALSSANQKVKSKRASTLESLAAAGRPLQSPLKDMKLSRKSHVKPGNSGTPGMPTVHESSEAL